MGIRESKHARPMADNDNVDHESPHRTVAGVEAHVRIPGGLCQCHGQDAEVAVERLREGFKGVFGLTRENMCVCVCLCGVGY